MDAPQARLRWRLPSSHCDRVLLPTWFLPIVLAALPMAHFAGQVPAGLESAMIFAMAVVPNLWGIWNAALRRLPRSIGVSIRCGMR